jgi:outer membrane protein, heavy metal efflux system
MVKSGCIYFGSYAMVPVVTRKIQAIRLVAWMFSKGTLTVLLLSNLIDRQKNLDTSSRYLKTFMWLCFLASCSARAQMLGEADVIQRAQKYDARIASAESSVAIAESSEVAAGLYPNPSLEWEHDQYVWTPLEADGALRVSFPVDLSSRRSTRTHLARSAVASARADVAHRRSAAVHRALTLFYALIGLERRVLIETDHLKSLEEAAKIVDRRKAEGTASGYDQARLKLEVEMARSLVQQSIARQMRYRAVLAHLLEIEDGTPNFTGDLKLRSMRSQHTPQNRNALMELEQATHHAQNALSSSSLDWIPEISVTGGPIVAHGQTVQVGFVAGVSGALPFFSRGQELHALADARLMEARAHAKEETRDTELRVLSADMNLEMAREEVQSFEERTSGQSETLQIAMTSGYIEGQRTLIELLDARRTTTALALHRLGLLLEAKKAEISLREARGEFQ